MFNRISQAQKKSPSRSGQAAELLEGSVGPHTDVYGASVVSNGKRTEVSLVIGWFDHHDLPSGNLT